jgi:hypothetical protein
MMPIPTNANLVAYCGLYCGACGQYLREKCPGCKENTKAGWCKIRLCCSEKGYATCADCADFKDMNDCKKFNNVVSKIFAVVFQSNRKACIEQIRSKGLQAHAEIMSQVVQRQSLPR